MLKHRLIRLNPVSVGLNLTPLVLFLALVIVQMVQPEQSFSEKPGQVPTDPADLTHLTQSRVSEAEFVYSRPIFHSDRHAAEKAPEKPVVEAVVQKPNIEMTGVLQMSQTQGWAFFRDKSSGETVQVAIGEDFQGWILKSLTSTQAIITNGVQETSLVLLGAEPLNMSAKSPGNENADMGQKPRTRRKK